MLQFAEGGKCQKGGLSLASLIDGWFFAELQDRHIFAPPGRTAVYILKTSGHGLFDHSDNAGFCGDTRHGYMFFAGADTGL